MTGLVQRGFPVFRRLLGALALLAAAACTGSGFSPDTFEVLADSPNGGGRAFHSAVTTSAGDVFLVGGQDADGAPLSGDRYADRFRWGVRLFVSEPVFISAGRVDGRAAWVGGAVVAAGGQLLGVQAGASAPQFLPLTAAAVVDGERYDPATLGPTTTVGLAGGAANAALVTDDSGDVFLIGGRDTGNTVRGDILRYDPGSGAFVDSGTGLLTAREGATATLLSSGEILIVGGWDAGGVALQSAELFDPVGDTIAAAPSPLLPRAQHTATASADRTQVLIYGGFKGVGVLAGNGTATEVAEVYRVGVGFQAVTSATEPLPRVYHSATRLDNGDVLVAGGVTDAAGTVTDSAQVFRFTGTGVFRDARGTLAFPRFGHTATLLPDHTVLVAGGLSAPGSLVPEAERYFPEAL